MNKILLLVVANLIVACDKTPQEPPVNDRWYTQTQVDTGNILFQTHCSSCHGSRAQGLSKNWRKRMDNNSFPPPPLNGTAHAWHHPLSVLLTTIQYGGAAYDGKMPGFKNTLSQNEQLAVIAFFQNYWPDKTYHEWQKLGGLIR